MNINKAIEDSSKSQIFDKIKIKKEFLESSDVIEQEFQVKEPALSDYDKGVSEDCSVKKIKEECLYSSDIIEQDFSVQEPALSDYHKGMSEDYSVKEIKEEFLDSGDIIEQDFSVQEPALSDYHKGMSEDCSVKEDDGQIFMKGMIKEEFLECILYENQDEIFIPKEENLSSETEEQNTLEEKMECPPSKIGPTIDKTFKCSLCLYQATARASPNVHKSTPTDISMITKNCFGCQNSLLKPVTPPQTDTCSDGVGNYSKPSCALLSVLDKDPNSHQSPCCTRVEAETNFKRETKDYKHKSPYKESVAWDKVSASTTVHNRNLSEDRYPTCTHCGKRFKQSSDLIKHYRIHTGEKPYPCTLCEKRFINSDHLKRHLRTHTGEKPYPCTHCGKRFNESSHLITHLRIHTGEKPYPCTHCGKRFNRSSVLKTHLLIHTGEKPYPCTQCEKRFNRSSHLITHLRNHTGEKPYPCTHCEKRFTNSDHLKRHLRTHTGEKAH